MGPDCLAQLGGIGGGTLKYIEALFGVTKRSTLTDTAEADHPTRRRRIAREIRHRNREADRPRHPLSRTLSIRDGKLQRQ